MKKLKNEDLNRLTIEEFKNVKKTPLIIVLDNVRSALNVGAIFRISDSFLIEKIILCGITATPPNNEIRKAALGSSMSVNWEKEKTTLDAVKKLKKNGVHVIGVEQVKEATLLQNMQLTKFPIAIVFGHEVNGVSQEVINICNEIVEIPQFGTKHSLNISVSAGILVWEIVKKLKKLIS